MKLIGVLFGVIVIVALNSLFIVDETKQAFLVQFGKVVSDKPAEPGIHTKIPFVQNVIYLDKRILNISSDSKEIIAGDQKRLIVDSYTKYRIVDPFKFYQSVRDEANFDNKIKPIIEASLRQNIGYVNLNSLLNEKRSEIMDAIQTSASRQSQEFGIEIIDVRIKKTDLPEENSAAIFLRMQTDREKEAREIRAEGLEEAKKIKSVADKESRVLLSEAKERSQILQGQGDAGAIQIFNESIAQDKDFYEFYKSMDAYKSAIKGDNTKLFISHDNDFLKYLHKKRSADYEK